MASGLESKGSLADRQLESYVDTGSSKSITLTLSGTPNTATSITVADTYKGIKLYPRSADIAFRVNGTVATLATSSATSITDATLSAGSIAKASQWEIRLLPSGTSRTLTILSATASAVVDLELF